MTLVGNIVDTVVRLYLVQFRLPAAACSSDPINGKQSPNLLKTSLPPWNGNVVFMQGFCFVGETSRQTLWHKMWPESEWIQSYVWSARSKSARALVREVVFGTRPVSLAVHLRPWYGHLDMMCILPRRSIQGSEKSGQARWIMSHLGTIIRLAVGLNYAERVPISIHVVAGLRQS